MHVIASGGLVSRIVLSYRAADQNQIGSYSRGFRFIPKCLSWQTVRKTAGPVVEMI